MHISNLKTKKSISIFSKIILVFSILMILENPLNAVAMVVEDPTANATLAAMVGKMADEINQGAEMIEKYTKMMQFAQQQVDKLNQLNGLLSDVNDFMNSSSISIANPMTLIDDIKDIHERTIASAKRLQNTIKNYQLSDHIHSKYLKGVCPEMDYAKIKPSSKKIALIKVGKETELIKASKRFLDAISDDINGNIESFVSTLSGRALAMTVCLQFAKNQHAFKMEKFEKQKRNALLNNDFDTYYKISKQQILEEKKFTKQINKAIDDETQPLAKRSTQMLETLGVQDKSYNKNGKTYCTIGKDEQGEEFCYPNAYDTQRLNDDFDKFQQEFRKKLQSAGSDEKKQSKVYADMKVKGNELLLSYVKDIANHLLFLNETMSLTSSIIAKDYKNKYNNHIDASIPSQKEEQQLGLLDEQTDNTGMNFADYANKAKFNQFGFPELDFTGNGDSSGSTGGLE